MKFDNVRLYMVEKAFTKFFTSFLKLQGRFSANYAGFCSPITHNKDTLDRARTWDFNCHQLLWNSNTNIALCLQVLPCPTLHCIALDSKSCPTSHFCYILTLLIRNSKLELGLSGRKTCARARYFDKKLFNN